MENTELFLRSIVETANEAIIISDSGGTIISWNQAAVDIFGYSHDEIIGKPVITVMPQRFHEAHRKGMRRVTATGKSQIIGSPVEVLGLRKDRTQIPLELSLAKWKTKDGQFFTAIIRDITERRQAGEALRESEEKFSRAFHSNPHPMSIVTLKEGRYLDVNDSYVQTFGFSREELFGRTTVEMGIVKNDRARRKILQSLKERQAIKNLEVEFHTRSGRKVEALLSADKTEIGGQTCLLSVITDITERKRMEGEIKRTRDYLEKLNSSLKEVIFNVTFPERSIEYVNRAVETVLGYRQDECIGQNTKFLYKSNKDYLEVGRKLSSAIENNKPNFELEFQVRKKDGEAVDVAVNFAFIKEQGELTRVISVFRDVTERKQAEEKRIKLIQELQETLKEVRTLSGLLPICAWCKKLRDDEGYWKSVEQYIGERTKAEFTHGMCPECYDKFQVKEDSKESSKTKVS